MEHAHNFKRMSVWTVDDQVRTDTPKLNGLFREVRPDMPHIGLARQENHSGAQFLFIAIGGVHVVLSDKEPDLVKICDGFG